MCQKCQIQTDENGAFSPGTRDAQAVCCLLLWLWGPSEGWEGKKQRARDRGRGRERESELFSQTWSLSLTKLRAPKPQCCLVPKGTTLQKLTSKRGAGADERKAALQRQTNKPRNLTVTLKKSNFLRGLNLVRLVKMQINSASTFELQPDLYLIDRWGGALRRCGL